MACSYINADDAKSFIQDVDNMMEENSASLLRGNSSSSRRSSMKSSKSKEVELIQLERGGVICPTKIGPIQFGMPPETVKDALNMGLEVPTYYIIPTKRFDKKFGISVAEFEFPAYFNFFVKKKQISLICSSEVEQAVRIIFQETLLGPTDHKNIADDFYYTYRKDAYPDFAKELSVFSRNPSNPQERLTIDHLLKFEIIDPVTRTATLQQDQIVVKIVQEHQCFKIIEDGVLIKSIKDIVSFPQEYNEYISIRRADDFRAESMPQIFTPTFRPKQGSITPGLQQLPELTFENKLEQVIKSNQEFGEGGRERDNKKKLSILLWNQQGQAKIQNASSIILDQHEEDDGLTFTPPDFGVTVLGCSHGFDPKGSTSGYIFWVHGRGIMVDPPPFASYHMKSMGIPSLHICAVIISHCHADHDAGTFHKILDDTRVEIITTRTIMKSFLRKYSAISGIGIEQLKRLFIFRPAIIGTPLNIYGANFDFFYAMHTIPSLGFSVTLDKKSIYFSSDTFYDQDKLLEYRNQGILSQQRYEQLAFPKFTEDIILHEAGVPPIHTSQQVLAALPNKVKNRMYLVHIAEKDLLKNSGLKIAKTGIENTMILMPSNANKHISTLRRLDLLSTIDIFEHLTLKNIRWLLDSLILEQFSPNEIVVKEGMLGNKFFIIESGMARLYSTQKGNEFERYYQVGDYFGESAVIQDKGRRGAKYFIVIYLVDSVVAHTNLRLLTLEKHDFWFIFGDGYGGQGPIIEKMKHLTEARKSKAIHVLFKNSVLSHLTPSQKTQLEMILTEFEIEKGTILWKVGDIPEFAFLVKRGTFEFIDCPEQEMDEFDSGAYIGEAKAMYENVVHTTSVRATRKSIIFKIFKNELLTFLSKNPGLYIFFNDYKFID